VQPYDILKNYMHVSISSYDSGKEGDGRSCGLTVRATVSLINHNFISILVSQISTLSGLVSARKLGKDETVLFMHGIDLDTLGPAVLCIALSEQ
jgi:hypothetical protein